MSETNEKINNNTIKCKEKNTYSKECNKAILEYEELNAQDLANNPDKNSYLYPTLNDPNFNTKIFQKKEFNDTRFDGTIHDVKSYADLINSAEFEIAPYQIFVRNFMSFQTPYNSLLLYHGLGTGKTCSAIGICEEMREYLKQMGINKKIIIVASPNVQDNFKLQLFDERKLKLVDGVWTMKGCLGNKFLKEINPTNMKGLSKEKIVQQAKSLINSSYSFYGYIQFSNDIVKISGDDKTPIKTKIQNLKREFDNSLIVIDEVHNINSSETNEKKSTSKNLLFLVSVVNNLRLLLLSATPMFNSYKEIIWLLNLMNINDRRAVISTKDVFDSEGNIKNEGRDLLIKKATGYISFVRGEMPYTFPFRVYPKLFAPDNTFNSVEEYPNYQLNGKKIKNNNKLEKLSLYLTDIGEYQQIGYEYIMNILRSKVSNKKQNFGYSDLQTPLQALNIIYPVDGLKEIVERQEKIKYSSLEESDNEIEEDEPEIEEIEVDAEIEDEDEIPEDVSPIIPEAAEETKEDFVEEAPVAQLAPLEPVIEPVVEPVSELVAESEPEPDIFSEIIQPAEKEGLVEAIGDNDEVSSLIAQTMKSMNLEDKVGGAKSQMVMMKPKMLTGINGLKRIMTFTDKAAQKKSFDFEYIPSVKEKYGSIFSYEIIGNFSSKIKSILKNIYNKENDNVSEGIVLIYSNYIDAGIIPIALCLEEMGFVRYGANSPQLFKNPPTNPVDVRTMKEPTDKKDFLPARYCMITGDHRLSPNNDSDVKALTNENNLNGEKIKVVLISQAGSEGLDFKAIRQVHILEPWYNLSRIEQIIGRGVRNGSHKDLPFEKRNVEIFLHGTLLKNKEEEAVDLFVYRYAEAKSVKIGKVTRLLKSVAVDCLLNYEQTQFTIENFQQIEANRNITQILSNNKVIENFKIGDIPNTAVCDYMDTCSYECLPKSLEEIDGDEFRLNQSTYNEAYLFVNTDKLIQKIKNLFRNRFFYKKDDLINYINVPKKYPINQIYAAITQIIEDSSEYLTDKYGRSGYLVNIGEYYLFQPSELNNSNISIFDRSVPIDYKHKMINFNVNPDIVAQKNIELIEEETSGVKVDNLFNRKMETLLQKMRDQYNDALQTAKVKRADNDWYRHCGVAMRKMNKDMDMEVSIEILEDFLIQHLVDSLMYEEKLDLFNYFNMDWGNDCDNIKDERFLRKIKLYMCSKIIKYNNFIALVLFNGPSKKDNMKVHILKNKRWINAEPQDIKDLTPIILEKYRIKKPLSNYIGFIGFETSNKYMIYKLKDVSNKRSKGSRCDQAGKDKTIKLLNLIYGYDKYNKKETKEGIVELCVTQEFTLRLFELRNKEDKVWFVDTETAILNDF